MLSRAGAAAAVGIASKALVQQALPAVTTLALPMAARSMRTFMSSSREEWPQRGVNTVVSQANRRQLAEVVHSTLLLQQQLNIVPQGHVHVVERFGKLSTIEHSGFYFGIPRGCAAVVTAPVFLTHHAKLVCGRSC